MLFRKKPQSSAISSFRVTPNPEAAAALEKKFAELNYHPGNGFHRDLTALRRQTPRLRLVR
jgi:hypothetical protein